MPLLSVEDIEVEFGRIRALDDLAFDVNTGQFCARIGPNSAGKTTLFNCVSSVYTTRRGSIRFDGRELLLMAPHRVARAGIARTFQNLALFRALAVRARELLCRLSLDQVVVLDFGRKTAEGTPKHVSADPRAING
ncbi:MAG: ATP-binding cassette domain-containing protein [Actinobacteria bacterium]|nr:ATP-binding cassette domain-containing protein [Actinomycetota bacterium]